MAVSKIPKNCILFGKQRLNIKSQCIELLKHLIVYGFREMYKLRVQEASLKAVNSVGGSCSIIQVQWGLEGPQVIASSVQFT